MLCYDDKVVKRSSYSKALVFIPIWFYGGVIKQITKKQIQTQT